MFDKKFVPEKPFSDFKWKWACLQCTEGLNTSATARPNNGGTAFPIWRYTDELFPQNS